MTNASGTKNDRHATIHSVTDEGPISAPRAIHRRLMIATTFMRTTSRSPSALMKGSAAEPRSSGRALLLDVRLERGERRDPAVRNHFVVAPPARAVLEPALPHAETARVPFEAAAH